MDADEREDERRDVGGPRRGEVVEQRQQAAPAPDGAAPASTAAAPSSRVAREMETPMAGTDSGPSAITSDADRQRAPRQHGEGQGQAAQRGQRRRTVFRR